VRVFLRSIRILREQPLHVLARRIPIVTEAHGRKRSMK
jgi:hypothetical protein